MKTTKTVTKNGQIFSFGYKLDDIVPVDYYVPGCPPAADQVKAVLQAMSAGIDTGINEGLKLEQEGVKVTKNSKDAMEGFTAFFEKREPNFTGE